MTNQTIKADMRTSRRWRRNLSAYRFVLPYLIFMLAFGLGPGIYAILISFADFEFGVPDYFAAGLQNYVTAFTDYRFGFTMGNIAEFLVVSVPLGIALVVLIALLLHMRPGRLSSTLRTLFFIPGSVTGPALLLLAIFMFSPLMSPFGSLLRALGYDSFDALIAPQRLPVIFTIIGFFSGAGMWIAIHYGALEGISHEVLEAARIDGCNAWQQAMYIKFPLIRPYIIYQFILIFAGNVQLFVEPQLLGTTWIMANVPQQWSPNQLAYSFAFDLGNFGAAAALSLLMLLVGLGAAYLVVRLTGFFDIKA
ncbi:MAG: sugar ABC transporter permease [Anaerolineales bacterium]|jgi:multiple sugar transport system permease protein